MRDITILKRTESQNVNCSSTSNWEAGFSCIRARIGMHGNDSLLW
eukprot:gene14346-15873_t